MLFVSVPLFTGHLFLMSRTSNKKKDKKEVRAYMLGAAMALYPKSRESVITEACRSCAELGLFPLLILESTYSISMMVLFDDYCSKSMIILMGLMLPPRCAT
jgi:hypothetical protein